ncbi:MAG TPA: quinolinate synthase NadA, partial [Fervidobacterium nodosum]|nr:quinolinate synthase NadA [Fervidobacterium nodosum]
VPSMVCYNMKKNNLKNTYLALLEEREEIVVPEEIAKKARKAIEKMLELTENRKNEKEVGINVR